MDINNNQQVNTFIKGMNTDVSDALIDSSQYRYAENLRLVTNTDSNSGELRLVDGTKQLDEGEWDGILAMTAVRDKVIVIGYSESEYHVRYISIYTNTYRNGLLTGPWKQIVRNLPYDEYVQEGETKPYFSLTTRWESENNIKLYIADGIHNIICLNITKDYTKDYEDNTTNDILAYATTELDAPTVLLTTGGTLKSAKVQYGFRLYTPGLPATQVSPLSKLMSLYKNYNEGFEPELVTNKAVLVRIPYRTYLIEELNFTKMQIYRITYVILGQQPTVDLVYDGDIIEEYIDRGGSIEQMGVNEFISLTQLQIVPKVIESKNDYMFAANLKYKQDEYDKSLEGLDFRSYSYGDWDDVLSAQYKFYTSARDYNKQYQDRDEYGKYVYNSEYWKQSDDKLGGFGPIVSWEFVVDNVLIDEDNNAKWLYYTPSGTNIQYEQRAVNTICSLRRGEVYRYGIVLYSKGGARSSVKWIADIMAPADDQYIKYPSEYYMPSWGYRSCGWMFQTLGVKFTVNTELLEDCSGFEIVRCKRKYDDSFTISLGIIGVPERVYKYRDTDSGIEYDETETLHPNGFMTTLPLSSYAWSVPDNKYLMFASPEYAYQPDDIKDIIKYNRGSLYLQDVLTFYHNKKTVGDIGAYDVELTDGNVIHLTNAESLGGKYIEILHSWKFEQDNEHAMVLYTDQGGTSVYGGAARITFGNAEGATALDSRSNGITETAITHVAALEKKEGIEPETIKITEYGFPDVPSAKELFDENGFGLFRDAINPVGSSTFNGWTASYLLSMSSTHDQDWFEEYKASSPSGGPLTWDFWYAFYSTTGKCVVFELDKKHSMYEDHDILVPITVTDLKKAAIPYNGPESYKTNSPDYFSHGCYMPIDLPREYQQSYSIDVFDGDCHPGIFVYHAAHCMDNSVMINANKAVTIYYVPVESDIDLRSTYGDLYTRKKDSHRSYYILDEAVAIDGYIQNKRAYLCNTAYNAEGDVISFSQVQYTDIDSSKFDSRIHHSELKTNNEHVDHWTEFKALNYTDVDSRFGEITNMRLFKDKLLYWLNSATGIVSVNERTVVNDLDDNQIVLGTGDVLLRYDYISTLYGMKKNQYEAEVQSNTTQYWWDGNNKEILAYGGGVELVPLTKVKNVQNYINSYSEVSRPSLSYDIKFNELISNVVTNPSLIYNEQVLQFTSIYTFSPIFRCIINNDLLLSPLKQIYLWNNHSNIATLFDEPANPILQYVVNSQNIYTKVFDISTFGGRFYGGDDLKNITFKFDTPLKQHSEGSGNGLITNREYDFRLDIPRNGNSLYGDRMRGKTMQCELSSSSNSTDFSLQYIVTKYRMSWS